jgi:hypothetical protein
MHQDKRRRFSRPITPSNTAIGLSSRVNQDFVLQILEGSERAEIESILHKARFHFAANSRGHAGERAAAIEREVGAYLRSAEGLRSLQQRINEAVKVAATAWLASTAGQKELAPRKGRGSCQRCPPRW